MKATGIVRRIDDLGRIVIPKEIRRTLRIREGDPMEIFTSHNGEIILKKYSPIGELSEFAKQYAEAIAQVTGQQVLLSDRDQYIAYANGGTGTTGGKKEWIGKAVTGELETLMQERRTNAVRREDAEYVKLSETDDFTRQVIVTIISEGDAIGSVIIAAKDGATAKDSNGAQQEELKVAQTAAFFLGKQMES